MLYTPSFSYFHIFMKILVTAYLLITQSKFLTEKFNKNLIYVSKHKHFQILPKM